MRDFSEGCRGSCGNSKLVWFQRVGETLYSKLCMIKQMMEWGNAKMWFIYFLVGLVMLGELGSIFVREEPSIRGIKRMERQQMASLLI